jgi:circadian clock protein KaiC
MVTTDRSLAQVGTGVAGLDELLHGGVVAGRMYLLTGGSGTGKTTLGMHFLERGIEEGETVLFVHGEESATELGENAAQFGIDLSGAEFLDLGPDSEFFTEDPSYDLVNPVDVEEGRYTGEIHDAIRDIDPDRVLVDPITQLRYVESSEHHYRKRILSFMRFLKQRDVTVLATATIRGGRESGTEIRSLSDGVVTLSRTGDGRRVEVEKTRGLAHVEGDHGLEIAADGVEIYPQIRPEPSDREFDPVPISSGIEGLDSLTGGGFERGSVTFISGPPGVGKTTVGGVYLTRSAAAGDRSAIYLFEERLETFLHRARSIGLPVDRLREEGSLSIQVIDPLTRSAEEFGHMVRREVEEEGAETVLIDGLGGYTSAIQGNEDRLERDLHTLTRYLSQREVTVFVTDAIHRITGLRSATSRQLSPIADNLLFLSYVELRGSLRKVAGVLKKRSSGFEHTLREFEITEDGIRVGESMTGLRGILHGAPQTVEWPDGAGDPGR